MALLASGGGSDDTLFSSLSQNGSHLGHNTNVLAGTVLYLASVYGGGIYGSVNVPPPAFGGGDTQLSTSERLFLCSMRQALPRDPDQALVQWLIDFIASVTGQRSEFIGRKMFEEHLCDDVLSAKKPVLVAKAEQRIAFKVDSQGFPVSSNPVWNICVKGVTAELTLPLIRSNPDRDSNGRPRTCRDYHKGDMAECTPPDLNMTFTWDPVTKQLTLPSGYVVIQETAVAAVGNGN